jgi:hypothetical protein
MPHPFTLHPIPRRPPPPALVACRGDPLEGWSLQYQSSPGATPSVYISKGLMGFNDTPPTSFQDTSTVGRQSASWVGNAGPLKASVSTNLGDSDTFFTTSVTLTNTGAVLAAAG